ncbi:hypothetical protein IT409_00350 [Candidatus Falkowbacteria bacterium]|nr:hypothetical protein [Candidatus Falkowbacteria bacterium]
MKILYFIFLIITTIISWLVILLTVGFLVGKDTANFLSPASVTLLLLPVWIYKTKKSLKDLSNILMICVIGFFALVPITYFSLLQAAYNSPPGKAGLGAAIGLPILAALFIVYICIGALITFLVAMLSRLLSKYEKRTK